MIQHSATPLSAWLRRSQTRERGPSLKALGLCIAAALASAQVQGAENIEEILVQGSDLGGLRLNQVNAAGSRLGLTEFETPASVSVISREAILAKGDHSSLSAITRETGISSSANPGNGGTQLSARGFNGHNSIVTTYDGTRLYVANGTMTFPLDTWTLERVEVLRGAGSLLNGIGAIGATVNYVPKAPRLGERDFELLAATGSYDLRRLALGGGAGLGENWAYRLDGSWQTEDSFVERNSEERKVAAGSLLFQPSEDLSVKFSVDYADIHEDSPYMGTPLINGEASKAHRKNNYNFRDGFSDYEDLWGRVRVDWALSDNVRFRSDSYVMDVEREWQNHEGFRYNPDTGLIDRDGFGYYGIVHDMRQTGSRADFLFDLDWGGLENRFTLGADVNVIDYNYYNNWSEGYSYVDTSVPVFGFLPDSLADANVPMALAFTTDTTQYGLFLDDVLRFNEQWSVVVGLRFDDIRYDRRDHALGGKPASSFDAGYSEFSWRAGAVYQPSDTLSFYGQYSQASDPVTNPVSMASGFKDWDLSRGEQVEVGVKKQIPELRAEYSLAWYNIVKTDLVTRIPGSMLSEQIGEQRAHGVEFALRISPLDTLDVDLNAAWVDAEFKDFWSGDQSLAGNRPPSVPDLTANLWLSWTPLSRLQLGAGARYVAARYTDNLNNTELPAYTLIDAAASWHVDDKLLITLRGRNLSNEEDFVYSEYAPGQWVFGEPRSFELGLRYSL